MKNLKNKKGFTLIELLAVIVILSIILVIAVPQVLKVITQAKSDSLSASVKMFASALETNYLTSQTSDTPLVAPIAAKTACPTVADFSNGSCCYGLTIDGNGNPTATVSVIGSGKFANLTGTGTKTSVTVSATGSPDACH